MSKKPLIGVTLDAQEPGSYSNYPWYALRENYCSAIVDAGGVPISLAHDLCLVDDYLSLIDALMITGGGHDVDPALYGAQECHLTVKIKPRRTSFEMEITRKALEKNIPVLGICGGLQLVNVVLGGTLIQHIPDEVPGSLEHNKKKPHDPCHTVKIAQNSQLHQIVESTEFPVNSVHHQAIKDVGPYAMVNALAPDGVIEGIESSKYRFCLGLQWHPEFIVTEHDGAIFKAFVDAARG